MNAESDVRAGDAMRLAYARDGLPMDGGRSNAEWTAVRVGPFDLRFSNFAWRRRALADHDLHHLLTGYPCTAAGEFQIAAWEFAAGRFPSVWSTLFCLPLVGLGAITVPGRSFAAFVRGRSSTTLYRRPWSDDPLELTLRELRDRTLPQEDPAATIADRIRYLGLVGLSLALLSAPFLVLVALLLHAGIPGWHAH